MSSKYIDLKELATKYTEGEININVDFTVIKCDCGCFNSYNQTNCSKCDQQLEQQGNGLDPRVEIRREAFANILSLIKANDEILKELKKAFGKEY